MRLSGGGVVLAFLHLILTGLVVASTSSSDGKRCAEPEVRREWRALSATEKAEFISAVKCLAKVPHREYVVPYASHVNYTLDIPLLKNSSMFDDFSFIHSDLNPLIHFTAFFFPWHRLFIHRFERALREECKFTGTHPYWDWTQDADDFYSSSILDPDPEAGFGGWGDPSDDFQITTGAFADDFIRPYPVPHRVRRNFTLKSAAGGFGDGPPSNPEPFPAMFTPQRIEDMVNGFPGDFVGFQKLFEGGDGAHGAIHQILGGDMFGMCPLAAGPDCERGPKWTPNDPLFYLHHAMVDKLWHDWQRRRPENFWAFQGGSIGAHSTPGLYDQFPNGAPPFLNFSDDVPGDGLLNNATIFELMDTQDYDLCYTYV